MRSVADAERNLADMAVHLHEMRMRGSDLAVFPEYAVCRGAEEEMSLALRNHREWQSCFSRLSAEAHTATVVAGVPVRLSDGQNRNRTYAFDANGKPLAFYDKCHLFSLKPDEVSALYEPRFFQKGARTAVFQLKGVDIGLATCFDIRFPEFLQRYRFCQLVICSAAFNAATGRAHWHALARARAIENQYFFAGAALGEPHYGHSVVYSPWGDKLAEAAHDQAENVVVDIDTDQVREVRERMPLGN